MDNNKIQRINELYRKSKTVGLTDQELTEQKQLRDEYRASIVGNLKANLKNVRIQNKDGSIEELKPKKK